MSKNTINVDLDDPRIGKIADVISNKTGKKILGELAEAGSEGLSESEILERLKIPANTINYNIKKLESAGLVEKVSGFLWSVKGKRIHKYRVSNRKIVISPKTGMKGILPAVLVSGVLALGIKIFGFGTESVASQNFMEKSVDVVAVESARVAESGGSVASDLGIEAAKSFAEGPVEVMQVASSSGDIALWFFLGALVGLLVFLIWSWRQNVK
ncbi:hypothetical protein CMI45_00780 [Candidatus Pacearchaeota archaeon]|nr:hypothetical protein [Candidatus Pacearchaeota archaeon]|tara:strand:- start:1222 stop:1860 length:639 start_codon:yes stop_codon:yes gene_type:complete